MDVGKATIKAAVISGLFGLVGVLAAAVIGLYGITLQNDIDELETQISTLQDDNNRLTAENAELREQYSDPADYAVQISKLETQISDLNKENSRLSAENESLKSTSNFYENVKEELFPYETSRSVLAYNGNNGTEFFSFGDFSRTKGIRFFNFSDDEPIYAIWNTEGKYKAMMFKIRALGEYDSTESVAGLTILLNGTYYGLYNAALDPSGHERIIIIPLYNTSEVKLEFEFCDESSNYPDLSYVMYDIYFQQEL